VLDQEDWYGYARDLLHLQQSTFPCLAGDALALAYQPQDETEPPGPGNRVLEHPGVRFAALTLRRFTPAEFIRCRGKSKMTRDALALDAAIFLKF
jgi:hypothetical protein